MNTDTLTLITRPYSEIVDDVLTAIVGGVVNEPIFFDLKETLYPLAQPASGVRTITGTRTLPGTTNPVHTQFLSEVDYKFDSARNAVAWQKGGAQPDDETTFYVDYYRPNGNPPLTDTNIGSVTRTLAEAISREIATVYQQIYVAYLSGFVDTASGQALDQVVAILNVTRRSKDFAVGLVTFFRDPAVDGNINIPQGTELRTAKGDAIFETADMVTLQRGQTRIDVPVQATEASKGPAGKVDPGTITTLSQAIAGISRVTNLEGTVLGANDETDDQLRARAKAALHGVGKATLLALGHAVFGVGAKIAEVWDPNSPPDKRTDPGKVSLLIETEPARFPSVQNAVNETRAAGVQATSVARYVFVKPRLVARVPSGLPAAGKVKLIGQIIDAMQSYVDTLKAGDPARGEDLRKSITDNVKELSDPTKLSMADVLVARANIGQPGPEATVAALLEAVTTTSISDTAALQTAFTNVLTNAPPAIPTFDRIPDQSLLRGPNGSPPTAAQIAAFQFQVNAVVGTDNWWIALDVEPADIVLVES